MGELVVAVMVGAIIGYPIALGTRRPILVALLLGVIAIAFTQLPPMIGLFLFPLTGGAILGCIGAWAYRRLKPRTE